MEFCKFNTTFTATTIIDKAFLPNSLSVAVTFTVNVVDPVQQNIAFQRIKHFLENELNFSIIMNKENPVFEVLSKMKTQNRIVLLPDDGPDWALCCALALKLNAICENRFIINLIELNSSLGDHVTYYADYERKDMLEDVLNSVPKADQWWHTSTIQVNGFQKAVSWNDVDLGWKLTKEKKSASIGKIVKFNPKVVKGGLN